MRERIENILGWLVGLAFASWAVWEMGPLDRLHDTPTLYYKRLICAGREPCKTVWGRASIRININNQTAIGLRREDGGDPFLLGLDNCSIWDASNWVCQSGDFKGHLGRRDGAWFSGDEGLHEMEWRFSWLMESLEPASNQLSAPQ